MVPAARLLLLLLAGAGCAAEEEFEYRLAQPLGQENFTALTSEGTWFVLFWAPWCGHCRRVKPLFAEASEKVNEATKFGMVDCTRDEGKPVCDEMGVHSYPSFRYNIKGGEMLKYDGPRTAAEDFVNVARRLGDENLHVLQFQQADIDDLRQRDEFNIFVFCTPGGAISEQVRWLAHRMLPNLRCYFGTHPTDSALCGGRATAFLMNDVGVEELTPEKCSVEECLEDEPDSVRLRSVLKYINQRKLLAVDRIDQTTFHEVARRGGTPLVIFVSRTGGWVADRPFLKTLREVTKKPVAKGFMFGWLDGQLYADWVKDLVDMTSLPTVLVYNLEHEGVFLDDTVRLTVQHAARAIDAAAAASEKDAAATADAEGDAEELDMRLANMGASLELMLQRVVSGELHQTFHGPAGYVLGPVQRFVPSLLPSVVELRKMMHPSDVLFIGVVIAIIALPFILIGQIFFAPELEPREADPAFVRGIPNPRQQPGAQQDVRQVQPQAELRKRR